MNKVSSEGNAGSTGVADSRKTQGILILGMHRSGTSACTRVLNMLGCALSDQLIGAGEGNEGGHWESFAAVSLNDEILASAGSGHEDWGPINPDWRQSAVRSEMVERASVVLNDHARLGPLFVLKDPRMCRLGDVWIEAATAAKVDPLVLVMLRNPLEVVASLEARDLMTTGYAELLWLRHVLDAEHFSRGHKRIFLRYDQLLSHWQGLITKCKDGLGVALPRNSPKVHAEIGQFLSQSQRHHHVDPAIALNDPTRSPWLREAFGIMLRWSESGEDPADYPALDELRAELDRSYDVFARLLLSEDMTGEVASGRRLRDQVGELQQASTHQAEALRLATEAAEGERAAAYHREAELAAAVGQAQANLAEVQAAIAAEQQARLEADNRHAAMLGDLQSEQLRNAELAGQLASLQSAILQRQEELAQLLAQFRETDALRLRAELESEREREQRLALEQAIAAAHDQITALQQQLAQAQAAAEQQAEARTADLAQLTLMLKAQEDAAEQAAAEASANRAEAQRLSQQVEQLANAANEAEAAQAASLAEVQRLSDQARQISAAADARVEALTTDLARLTQLIQAQEDAAEAAQAASRAEAERLSEQITQLTEAAKTAEAARTASLAEAQRLSHQVAQLTSAASTAEAARTTSERKLAARFDELARLTAILSEESRRAEASDTQSQWLRDVRRLEESFPAWWAIMPAAWRQRRTHQRYARAGLFDAAAYLALYPDVATEAMDPIRHYILHGMAEGRTRPVPF